MVLAGSAFRVKTYERGTAMVRVGIAGLGFMGRTHFGIYQDMPNVEVVALMDRDKKRREGDWAEPIGNLPASWPKKVDMKGRKSYASLDEMLQDPDIDVIDITLPTNLHAEAVIRALKAGKHVLCEKPMARTYRDCRRILQAYKKSKSIYMVAQCIRFWPHYVKIKELVQSKKYGRLRSVALKRLASPPDYSYGNWLLKHALSGGALLDLHVHDIDYAQVLIGKPKRIYAQGTKGPSGGIDHIEALWDYGRDMLVSIEGGWTFSATFPFEMAILVRCEKATIKWFMSEGPKIKVFTESKVEEVEVEDTTGWHKEIEYFINCVEGGTRPKLCTPESSAMSIRLAEAELRSATARR